MWGARDTRRQEGNPGTCVCMSLTQHKTVSNSKTHTCITGITGKKRTVHCYSPRLTAFRQSRHGESTPEAGGRQVVLLQGPRGSHGRYRTTHTHHHRHTFTTDTPRHTDRCGRRLCAPWMDSWQHCSLQLIVCVCSDSSSDAQ